MKLRLFTMLFALLLAGLAWAAENAPQDQAEQVEQETQINPETDLAVPIDTETAPADPGLAAGDADAEAIAEGLEDEESPGRFIPTEQISQDLGVSFPVDI